MSVRPSVSQPLPGGRLPDIADEGRRAARRRAFLRRARTPLLVSLLCIVWIVLLGWAARAPATFALQPAQRLRFQGSDFRVVFGSGVSIENERRLSINAVGTEHTALQSAGARPADRCRDFPGPSLPLAGLSAHD